MEAAESGCVVGSYFRRNRPDIALPGGRTTVISCGMKKRLLIMSAATAGLIACVPAPLSAADDESVKAGEVADTETVRLSIVLARGGG